MAAMEFSPVSKNIALSPGLVLQVDKGPAQRYLRLTHILPREAYVMGVSTPEAARYAKRPYAITLSILDRWLSGGTAVLGKMSLPHVFSKQATDDEKERKAQVVSAFEIISPLLDSFRKPKNLQRRLFTSLIRARAADLEISPTTVRRLLLRYYYFGLVRDCLAPLPSGAEPGKATYSKLVASGCEPRRRGRQPVIAKKLGRNEFVVGEADISDMVAAYKASLRKGVTYKTDAHEVYLRDCFSKRHPDIYKNYLLKKCPEPVTYRQFKEYVNSYAVLSAELELNLPNRSQRRTKTGALRSIGPGEIYEIDATGGRVFIVDSQDPSVVLGTPTIYLLIDRWSRYIPSVYVSAKAPSWEEARYALLIAFTPRKRRFRAMGVDVDENRWPAGRVCAVLVQDRGSEFLSSDAAVAAAESLKIELDTLPPQCPDGKAIIERLIRELKRRMATRGMKGTFARRPLGPRERRQFRQARQAAAWSLAEVYRTLIEIVIDHNTRPHSALRGRPQLTRAGVRPVPQDAYLWGLKNITGIQAPPLNDEDYLRMLLASDTARVAKGVLGYRGKTYLPANELAEGIARRAGQKGKSARIRVDKTDPIEAFIETPRGEWAKWTMSAASQIELRGTLLDEEDLLRGKASLLSAEAENDSRITRLQAARNVKAASRRREAANDLTATDRGDIKRRRERETKALKRSLTGKKGGPPSQVEGQKDRRPAWQQLEESERLKTIEETRRRREGKK